MTAHRRQHVGMAAVARAVRSAAGIIGALWGLSCSVTVSEASLFPPRIEALPPMSDIARRNVELTTRDGVRLRGWRLERPGSVRTVLFFYGNRSSVVDSAWSLDWLARTLEADVIAFDYRGYGFSDGSPSVDKNVLSDALEVHAFAVGAFAEKARPVVAVGQSMGTAAAMHLAASVDLESVILLAPLASTDDALAGLRASTPWYVSVEADASLASLRASPLADAPRVREPTLFVGGDSDVLASPQSVERLARACAARPVKRCSVPGGHGDVRLENPAVRGCVERFVAPWRGGGPKTIAPASSSVAAPPEPPEPGGQGRPR